MVDYCICGLPKGHPGSHRVSMFDQGVIDAQTKRDELFADWLYKVDVLARAKYGIGVDDGVDWPSRDTFYAGTTPRRAVAVWRRAQRDA